MQSKKWYQSSTIWFNILAGIVAIAGMFGFGDFKPTPETAEWVTIVMSIVNMYLRFKTRTGIKV